jgi:hypothetical protein
MDKNNLRYQIQQLAFQIENLAVQLEQLKFKERLMEIAEVAPAIVRADRRLGDYRKITSSLKLEDEGITLIPIYITFDVVYTNASNQQLVGFRPATSLKDREILIAAISKSLNVSNFEATEFYNKHNLKVPLFYSISSCRKLITFSDTSEVLDDSTDVSDLDISIVTNEINEKWMIKQATIKYILVM